MATVADGKLDAGALLTRAKAEMGLSDWGDASFERRLGLAVDHINGIPMDAAGRKAAADNIDWLLTDRLRFFEDRKRYPLADEVIDRPMFATGEPRSGTTLMHALMAVDPAARALRFWEVTHPSPPPGAVEGVDPRLALADDEWREINAKMWKWLHCHPYNDMLGNGLPEDERTWAFDFRVMTPTAWWRVPMQNLSLGLPTDSVAQNRIHKMMLQALQYRRPTKYWVLKGFHGHRLKEFFETYPDATLVWLHRDPVAGRRVEHGDDARHHGRDRRQDRHGRRSPNASGPRARFDPEHDVEPADRRSTHPACALQGFRRRPDRHGAQILRLRRPRADAAGGGGDAGLPGRQQGRPPRQVRILDQPADRRGFEIDALNEEFRPFRERFDVSIEKRG